jgi:hypothetical protein
VRIRFTTSITLFTALILSSTNGSAQILKPVQSYSDDIPINTIEAKFVKRTVDEHCGYFHSPGKNLFEIVSWENGKFVKKYFEVEYSSGCNGASLIPGQKYSIRINKFARVYLYKNRFIGL